MVVIVATRRLGSSSGLAELQHFLDTVVLAYYVGVHSVHGDVVVVDALRIKSILVELKIIALQNLVFVQREGVLDRHVLYVFVGQQMLRFPHVFVEVLILKTFALVLHSANEFIQNWNVPEFLHFDLEDVLNLSIRLSRILRV